MLSLVWHGMAWYGMFSMQCNPCRCHRQYGTIATLTPLTDGRADIYRGWSFNMTRLVLLWCITKPGLVWRNNNLCCFLLV